MVKIINDDILDRFRRKTTCELCGKPARGGCDPHHAIVKRGIGGGSRIDHPYNLIACHRECHQKAERGEVTVEECADIIAKREGFKNGERIIEFVKKLRNLKLKSFDDVRHRRSKIAGKMPYIEEASFLGLILFAEPKATKGT